MHIEGAHLSENKNELIVEKTLESTKESTTLRHLQFIEAAKKKCVKVSKSSILSKA